MSASKLHTARYRVAAGVCVAVYAALLLPTLARHGIGWDEQTDLGVATSYVESGAGWLRGSDVDPINVRLPMATAALFFAVLGGPDLLIARWISAALGALTLVAVFLFCRRELDARKGIAACALLATSPYYLAYARTAFSEGDVFVTCALAWLLVCLAHLRRERTLGWAVASGVVFGAALASKISAAAALPVVIAASWLPAPGADAARGTADPRAERRIGLVLGALWVALLGGWEVGRRLGDPTPVAFLAAHAATVEMLWLAALATAAAHPRVRGSRGSLTALATGVGALTFFALPPMHTTNPLIVQQLFGAFLYSNLQAPAGFALEAVALHASVVAIKPGLAVGVAAWLGAIVAAWRARRRPALRLPLLLLLCYVLFLLRLPWAQTFYMLPTLPLLMILLADALVDLYDARRGIALALAGAMALGTGADLVRSYPDLHLNGYQWIGARPWAGRPSVGPRSVVPIPTDGVEQALRYVDANARAGDVVITFLRPQHIREALLAHSAYRLVDGLANPRRLARADWVVTTLAAEIRSGYGADDPDEVFAIPYDRALLERRFRKVFAVERAFGLEVAAVWRAVPRYAAEPPRDAQSQRTPVPPSPQ